MDGTTTTTSGGAGEEESASDAPTSEQPQLLATAVGDQCANCGARLAGDQRYCVECGERRGKPRYSLPGIAGSAGEAPVSPRRPRRTLTGSGALIGGIGVLLIAMGVGVLIGRTSNGSTPRNSGVQVVTVAGAGGAAAAGTTPTTSSTPRTSATSASKSKSNSKSKNPAAALAAKLPAKAKVIPKKLKSAVAKVGSKCAAGAKGCTNGKFTGTFFGGG
jgi:hypothetical protein